ncbi:Dam family site-specific DNA-(adenine-N6)-methyltransferase [Streptococcus sanguinis]|uniref:Dam family site-specific DNA-(adenine-N6)-methyltransferase n=1 Tax=Streptococcus sanguinis TaxID=1305 RepID=UPI001CBC6B08|nr:Dam family site-specific DNA-(adenine-N6)-methyltransferase [Streptococcus sanguinis]MBZ2062622.1 Dam family site-specific DNA-(adenine-N6)-methyltransferase [Streptococcus sanguinis]MBZ2064833.1 Dam family site-specific DNA-(adenine-N6)-methyltransferase [Streptococcus sanguinis]HES1965624.1 Dam family site-specific DNA-(adenine-N6)-methyltransferase [Streptococcus pyogenes]
MKNKKGIRSPFFYVGDKYKLMPQLKELFPEVINNYYDVFCGGGSASINVKANNYYLNDIDSFVIKLHKWINENSSEVELLIKKQYDLINKYNLSHSEFGLNTQIENLKLEFKKTYFSKYNKENYSKLRDDFNDDQENMQLLYLLLVYGFNHMIRFNKNGLFNLPVGNVDWNKNVTKALKDYASWVENSNEITYSSLDFETFVYNHKIEENDFLYFDPPYLITFSDYNKLWNEIEEKRLYQLLDKLDSKGIKWGLSNMLNHKGKENSLLLEWAQKYNEYSIKSNYISRFDNSIKEDSKEIFVTNYSK